MSQTPMIFFFLEHILSSAHVKNEQAGDQNRCAILWMITFRNTITFSVLPMNKPVEHDAMSHATSRKSEK